MNSKIIKNNCNKKNKMRKQTQIQTGDNKISSMLAGMEAAVNNNNKINLLISCLGECNKNNKKR